jgi:hypothetical protein
MDPLLRVDSLLWLHVSIMTLLIVLFAPALLVLAKVNSVTHRYASAVFIVLLASALLALTFSETAPGHPNYHATVHTVLGVITIVFLAASALFGVAIDMSPSLVNVFRELHWGVSTLTVLVLLPWQGLTGVAALFQVCSADLSGRDQCVGHFGPAFAMWMLALAYLTAVKQPVPQLPRREAWLVATLGFFVVVYSLATEWPYTNPNGRHHLTAGFLALIVGGLGAKFHDHPSQWLVERGVPVAVLTTSIFVIFQMHHQVNQFGKLHHTLFSVCILLAGVARLCKRFGVTSFLLYAASVFFITSQRGFALLYERIYVHQASLGVIVFVEVLLIVVPSALVKAVAAT